MAEAAFIRGRDVIGWFAGRDAAVMATRTLANDIVVVDVRPGPCDG